MAGKKTMKLASRGRRFGAACIDAAIPMIICILMIIIVSTGSRRVPTYNYGFGNDFSYGYGYGYGYGYNSTLTGAAAALLILMFVLLTIYAVVQFVLYSKAKSIGKAILGLQVISSIDGSPLGFWKMVLRECIVKSASSSFFCLGYIWILIDEKNRGWHDKIIDTYVVDLKETEKLMQARSFPETALQPSESYTPAPDTDEYAGDPDTDTDYEEE